MKSFPATVCVGVVGINSLVMRWPRHRQMIETLKCSQISVIDYRATRFLFPGTKTSSIDSLHMISPVLFTTSECSATCSSFVRGWGGGAISPSTVFARSVDIYALSWVEHTPSRSLASPLLKTKKHTRFRSNFTPKLDYMKFAKKLYKKAGTSRSAA